MALRPAAKSAKTKAPATAAQLKKLKRARRYHQKNRETLLQRKRERHSLLTPAQKLLRSWRMRAKPPVPRPGSVRSREPRLVAVAQAFCDWSDIEEVVRTHLAAAVMTELTGVQYVVDHAVPLINPFVCGLHTHTNLQVVTEEENARKRNWLWPQMWPISWESLEILEKAC